METSLNILTTIADNFCLQTITLQNSIMLRNEARCLPTPQELNMQTKMVANIIKIKKLIATDHVGMAMTRFFRFISKGDKQLAKTVAEQYMKFMGIDDRENQTASTFDAENNNEPSTTVAIQNNIVAVTEQEAQPNQTVEISIPSQTSIPVVAEHINGQEPPFTRADFEEHKYQLHNYESGDRDTTLLFRGEWVNKRWFEYNLLQYTLPVHKRGFLQDENTYPQMVNHADTQLRIRHYLSNLQLASEKENAA